MRILPPSHNYQEGYANHISRVIIMRRHLLEHSIYILSKMITLIEITFAIPYISLYVIVLKLSYSILF